MADRVSSAIRVLQRAGFKGDRLKTAFAIVMRESGGNPRAHNTNRATGDDSYGLAQINMLGSMGPARRRQFGLTSDAQLLDPLTNARAMYRLSGGGKDFGAWGIGPNAYRTGAGMDTIRPFLAKFPGGPPSAPAGEAPPAAALTSAPGANPSFALALINYSRARRGEEPLIEDRRFNDPGPDKLGPFFPRYEDGSGLTPLQEFLMAAQATPRKTAPRPKGRVLALPKSFKGTHVTDNLGWGTKTARDIMAPAGTPVGAPESGTVLYFHEQGAQGGGSMELLTPKGKRYWLGHIANGLPAGTRVKRGQPLAVVADQNVSAPHVHIDKR